MSFREICLEILKISEGLEYGEISFTFDKLASAMKMGHPAEFLMELLEDVFLEVRDDIVPTQEKVSKLLKGLKRFQRNFKVKELSKPIKDLSVYMEQMN